MIIDRSRWISAEPGRTVYFVVAMPYFCAWYWSVRDTDGNQLARIWSIDEVEKRFGGPDVDLVVEN